jgi:hypothetical protein
MKRLNGFAFSSLAAAGLWLGLAIAAPAQAQSTINPEQACRDDAFRLCNEFIPDRDKTGACLAKGAQPRLPHRGTAAAAERAQATRIDSGAAPPRAPDIGWRGTDLPQRAEAAQRRRALGIGVRLRLRISDTKP